MCRLYIEFVIYLNEHTFFCWLGMFFTRYILKKNKT